MHKVKCKIIICLPRISLTHHQTSHGEQFHSHTTFSTVSPDLFAFIACTPGEPAGVHVWNAQGASGRPANSSILWQKPSGSPRCWAMSTGPSRWYQTLGPLSRSLLLIIWSETFIAVVCWGNFVGCCLCSTRSLLHTGTDNDLDDGLKTFYGPVQLSAELPAEEVTQPFDSAVSE